MDGMTLTSTKPARKNLRAAARARTKKAKKELEDVGYMLKPDELELPLAFPTTNRNIVFGNFHDPNLVPGATWKEPADVLAYFDANPVRGAVALHPGAVEAKFLRNPPLGSRIGLVSSLPDYLEARRMQLDPARVGAGAVAGHSGRQETLGVATSKQPVDTRADDDEDDEDDEDDGDDEDDDGGNELFWGNRDIEVGDDGADQGDVEMED